MINNENTKGDNHRGMQESCINGNHNSLQDFKRKK